jgi:hypothetical protein
MMPFPGMDEFITRLAEAEQKQEKWTSIDRIGSSSGKPLTIVKVGEIALFWASTGPIADDGTAIVYFTDNGAAGGEGVYENRPLLDVKWAPTGETFTRAAGVRGASDSFRALDQGGDNVFYRDLEWVRNNECWRVTITNKTGASRDFSVMAVGV